MPVLLYNHIHSLVVFVTGQSGAGFQFVAAPLLRPSVNSLLFRSAWYDKGPGRAIGLMGNFTFPADSVDDPVFASPTLAPVRGPTYSYE